MVYIICGLMSSSFVTNYVVVVVLLMLDFWTVRHTCSGQHMSEALECTGM